MSDKEKILVIITGGTIDSFYDATKDTVVPSKYSIIPSFIKSLKLNSSSSSSSSSFIEVCMKDSRSLVDKDIKKVLNIINTTKVKKIIITHGTYTMPDTARFLESKLKRKDQTIILTGSMIPIVGFSPSDAPFNLGFAYASIKTLEPGVYVGMNGHMFHPKEVVKRISEGKFVSIFNK